MNVKVTVDLKGWNHVVKALATMSGKDLKEVVDAETSEILSQASNRKSTKMADKKDLVGREMPVGLNFIGYTGNKKGYTVKAGKAGISKTTTYLLHHRLPFRVWNYIQQRTKDTTQEAFGNVGLAKGQFAHFFDVLKLPSPKKNFHRQAINFIKIRRNRLNGKVQAKKVGVGKEYANTFRSDLSKSIRFGGSARSLKSVMKARLKKFQTAIKKGTFKEIKKRTRAYPLIFGN
jgi:uncharacterized ubiquitin-like protein YukD